MTCREFLTRYKLCQTVVVWCCMHVVRFREDDTLGKNNFIQSFHLSCVRSWWSSQMLSRMFFSLWCSEMFKSGRRIVFIFFFFFNFFFFFCSIPLKKKNNLYLDCLFFNAKYAGSRWICTRNPSFFVLDEKWMLGDGDFYSAFFFSMSGVPANWCLFYWVNLSVY